jgi:multicomponent Na+:H+ antiporter subunit C
MSLALTIGLLIGAGVFLVLQRGMIRIILGFVLLTHGVNLLLIAAGGTARRVPPFDGTDAAVAADPLPQAFVLTAIVIAFAITVVMATFAVVGRRDDDTESDDTVGYDTESDDTVGDDRPDGAARGAAAASRRGETR